MSLSLEALGSIAADTAMKAAIQYLTEHDLEADDDVLVDHLRSCMKAKMPEAIKDASDAIAVGMGKIAETTFLLSAALAGIEAAKEAGHPKGAVA